MYFKTIRNVSQINFVVLSILVRIFPPVSRSSILTAKMPLGKTQQMEIQFLRLRPAAKGENPGSFCLTQQSSEITCY